MSYSAIPDGVGHKGSAIMALTNLSTLLGERLVDALSPVDTGIKAVIKKMPEIRAVVFDIYGTLFISASGDIGVASAENRAHAMIEALEKCAIVVNGNEAGAGEKLVELFTGLIRSAQDAVRARGVQFPEVEIRDVWTSLLKEILENGLAQGKMLTPGQVELLAIDYECRVNPVWPMPSLKETLSRLHDSHMLMGIVSNAQFFTPPLFECFLGRSVEGLDFEPSCTVYSYTMHEAKPSTRLYEILESGLAEHGFTPQQALYVGNDMRNDIAPAASLGFKTCLFAGDKRSLRLREGDPLVEGVEPDCVITDLTQIFDIICGA